MGFNRKLAEARFENAAITFVNTLLVAFHKFKVTRTGEKIDTDDMVLTFEDHFDGDRLNEDVWRAHNFYGVRKGGYWSGSQLRLEDSNLVITTQYLEDGEFGPGWYTSGIETEDKFEQTYGYFECRCILPKGVVLWSAFWMISNSMAFNNDPGEVIGGADGAEVDVFESAFYESRYPRRVSSNIHVDGYGEYHRQSNVCKPFLLWNDPYENFNTYGLEWNEKGYIFYVNGIETGRSDFGGASQAPEYLLLSVEVGGSDAVPGDSWAGTALTPDSETTDFIVDYVRAYQYK